MTTSYSYDGADHLTAVNGSAVTSDLDGNVTSDGAGGLYSWDVRGRLVGLTKNGSSYSFQYGPDNLRLSKTVNGVLTTYLLDGEQVVTDTIAGTAYQTLYGPGTDHALARNGEYFLPNHLSSTTGLTDGSGNLTQSYSYGPFGESLNSPTDSNPFQYTGRENDGDGLLYYRARYYCPAWGRFVSADPVGFDGGINPYVYTENNPANRVDPSGKLGEDGELEQQLEALGPAGQEAALALLAAYAVYQSTSDLANGVGHAIGDLWNGVMNSYRKKPSAEKLQKKPWLRKGHYRVDHYDPDLGGYHGGPHLDMPLKDGTNVRFPMPGNTGKGKKVEEP